MQEDDPWFGGRPLHTLLTHGVALTEMRVRLDEGDVQRRKKRKNPNKKKQKAQRRARIKTKKRG